MPPLPGYLLQRLEERVEMRLATAGTVDCWVEAGSTSDVLRRPGLVSRRRQIGCWQIGWLWLRRRTTEDPDTESGEPAVPTTLGYSYSGLCSKGAAAFVHAVESFFGEAAEGFVFVFEQGFDLGDGGSGQGAEVAELAQGDFDHGVVLIFQ